MNTTIHLANHSAHAFHGWKRVTTDQIPDAMSGSTTTGERYYVGRSTGSGVVALDVHVYLAAGESKTLVINSTAQDAVPLPPPELPGNPWFHFGGLPTVDGNTMILQWIIIDGAGVTTHWRCPVWVRDNKMQADLTCTWYPYQGWCRGEMLLTASNPDSPALIYEAEEAIVLTFGDAIVQTLGGTPGVMMHVGNWLADGQARILPLTFTWLRHCVGTLALSSVAADASYHVCGYALRDLLPEGNPVLPAGFNGLDWARPKIGNSIRVLHTQEDMVVGVPKGSGVTGAQEDQLFRRGECFEDGVGAELIAYLAACKFANRPCHYREANGVPLRPADHPQLVLWDGRPHWHTGVSPDRLGKPVGLTPEQTTGWWGPDVEHWLINTLVAGKRLTGSLALEELLRAQATVYLLQQTWRGWEMNPTTGKWEWRGGPSTSQPFASRAIGYEARNVVLLYENLEDRGLAEQVKANWLERWMRILKPYFEQQRAQFPTGYFMDTRLDDPRLGAGWWWIPWQQSVGALGLAIAADAFGVPEAATWAMRFAKQVVDDAWHLVGDRWKCSPNRPISGEAPKDEVFNYFGMCLAPSTEIRLGSSDQNTHSLHEWLVQNIHEEKQAGWMDPKMTRSARFFHEVAIGTMAAPESIGAPVSEAEWLARAEIAPRPGVDRCGTAEHLASMPPGVQ